MTNSVSLTSVSPAPLSTPNSNPSPQTTSSLRPLGCNINPSTQSKLMGTNGSAVKMGGFGQNTTMHLSQEGSQDKQVEQAKLVSFVNTCSLIKNVGIRSFVYYLLILILSGSMFLFFAVFPK